MGRLLCFLTILLSFEVSYSQDFITISGKIIDAETQEPLAFSTISVLEKPIGVVANEEGSFEFTFSEELQRDSLVISMMGYASEKYLLQTLTNKKDLLIKLVSKVVMLDEVVVTDKPLTAEDILDLVRQNIKNNYPINPFEFEAFYRDYKIENDKCVGLFEAAVSVYDKKYSKVVNRDVLKEKVTLNQVRKSLTTSYQTHAFKRINIMKELLRLNDVRYQSRALDKKRKYKRELDGYKIIDDRLMYRIKAVEDWTFYIYVDVATYAVPKIEMDFVWKDNVAENEWTLGDTIRYQQRSAKEILEFQLIDGRYYPKYHSFRTVLHAFDFNSDSLLFMSDLLQEYMVTDIDFSPEEKPEKDNLMDPHEMLEKQETIYDPEFWKHYNILKMHPRDEQLVRGLEKN